MSLRGLVGLAGGGGSAPAPSTSIAGGVPRSLYAANGAASAAARRPIGGPSSSSGLLFRQFHTQQQAEAQREERAVVPSNARTSNNGAEVGLGDGSRQSSLLRDGPKRHGSIASLGGASLRSDSSAAAGRQQHVGSSQGARFGRRAPSESHEHATTASDDRTMPLGRKSSSSNALGPMEALGLSLQQQQHYLLVQRSENGGEVSASHGRRAGASSAERARGPTAEDDLSSLRQRPKVPLPASQPPQPQQQQQQQQQPPRSMAVYLWQCQECFHACNVMKSENRCICGHRFREHNVKPAAAAVSAAAASAGDRRSAIPKCPCTVAKCPCKDFFYMVAEGAWIVRCRCKHKHTEHEPNPPYLCTRCKKVPTAAGGGANRGGPPAAGHCCGFDSPFVCNCNHGWASHRHVWELRALAALPEVLDEFGDPSLVRRGLEDDSFS